MQARTWLSHVKKKIFTEITYLPPKRPYMWTVEAWMNIYYVLQVYKESLNWMNPQINSIAIQRFKQILTITWVENVGFHKSSF